MTLYGIRDGKTFEPALDLDRLNKQMVRVWSIMQDGQWYTLADIAYGTRDPEASISARIRDFRKQRFGGHVINRRREGGTFEYQLVWSKAVDPPTITEIRDAWA